MDRLLKGVVVRQGLMRQFGLSEHLPGRFDGAYSGSPPILNRQLRLAEPWPVNPINPGQKINAIRGAFAAGDRHHQVIGSEIEPPIMAIFWACPGAGMRRSVPRFHPQEAAGYSLRVMF
ncbi:MAG: hypothetical protein ACK5II_14630 [Paracoccus sp. (in: a-proteobacteria)]